jgi:hypothetical protein
MFICVAGVVFYSTPHGGSQIAKLNSVVKYIFFPTVEVQELGKETMNKNNFSTT